MLISFAALFFFGLLKYFAGSGPGPGNGSVYICLFVCIMCVEHDAHPRRQCVMGNAHSGPEGKKEVRIEKTVLHHVNICCISICDI